jgi:CSLREA domain-containing protein
MHARAAARPALVVLVALALCGGFLLLNTPLSHGGDPPISVNSIADDIDPNDGECTLREAIISANTDTDSGPVAGECDVPDASTIWFVIQGAGPHTIAVGSSLPNVEADGITIDGTSEPDYDGDPVVVIDGTAIGSSNPGLNLKGDDLVVRGLEIRSFTGAGIATAFTSSGTLVEDNLSTNNGTSGGGIDLNGNNHIARNNVFTANMNDGLDGSGDGNLIEFNHVTDNRDDGITFNGDDNIIRENIIVGNGEVGADVRDSVTGSNLVEANVITGNGFDGMQIVSIDTVIVDNLISGNGLTGIDGAFNPPPDGLDFVDNVVTDNAYEGIFFTSTGATISGNTISGNGFLGNTNDDAARLRLVDSVMSGNIITGNHQDGLTLMSDSANNQIFDNTITNNADSGVRFFGAGGSVLWGNQITGNEANGLVVDADVSDGLLIGGPQGKNEISENGGAGVLLIPAEPVLEGSAQPAGDIEFPPVAVTISMNSISDNGGLGIDLAPEGVTANDESDNDDGANRRQNFPVLVTVIAGSLFVEATLNSVPNTNFQIEFFANDACDDSGHGEGQEFLANPVIITNDAGDASFDFEILADITPGRYVTATATNVTTGDTSEFSNCLEITLPDTPSPKPTLSPTPTTTRTPTPTGTPEPELAQGDNDCDGDADSVDALKGLQHVAAIDFSQEDGCPSVGGALPAAPASDPPDIFGDVDCDNDVDSVDQLKTLQFVAAIPFSQNEPCTNIGDPL